MTLRILPPGVWDLADCVRIQQEVWGLDDAHLLSREMLSLCIAEGGLLLGACLESRLVGFALSLPAVLRGTRIHHSHMLAVLPGFRDQRIGYRLKMEQRAALRSSVPLLTWTFDPLEARNSYLNLELLGVRIAGYFVDFYGVNSGSALHSGIGTDRFLVEWLLAQELPDPSRRKGGRLTEDRREICQAVVRGEVGESGILRPVSCRELAGRSLATVEIPEQIQQVKSQDPGTAMAWREVTRQAFQSLLGSGYQVAGLEFRYDPHAGVRRVFYVFERTGGSCESN